MPICKEDFRDILVDYLALILLAMDNIGVLFQTLKSRAGLETAGGE